MVAEVGQYNTRLFRRPHSLDWRRPGRSLHPRVFRARSEADDLVLRAYTPAMVVLTAVVLASGLSPRPRPPAQAPDAARIYKEKCALCHDAAQQFRAPDREALKELTPESILASLTSGTMAAQGDALSAAEKRAVAEFLSGKPMGRADPRPGQSTSCRTGATPSTIR
jgi:mono/diheme cytochrome c family protein